jgi:hypothetical protein
VAIRGKRGAAQRPLLVFSVSAELIEQITIGLASEGLRVDRIVPAQAAWACWALRHSAPSRLCAATVGVYFTGEPTILELEHGALSRVRRHRATDNFPPTGPERRWQAIGGADANESAPVAAAAAAGLTKHFEIVPDSVRRARLARERRIAAPLAAYAFIALVGAAVAFRWRLERQLSDVAARRSALQSHVSRAVTSRDSLQRNFELIAAVAEVERSAARWSAVLSRIALTLPEDAVLSSIRADADSLALDGQSSDASRVVSALRRAPGVKAARVTAPIVRESSVDSTSTERWHLEMRVDHRAAVAER